ncbi:MAG: type I restriction endonuclease subunit R, partial [Candidatus Thorarchaeota archaeon]
EGVEKLFHYVQIMIVTHFDKARFGTVGTCADEYIEWKDSYPKSEEDLSTELGADYVSGQHILVAGMLHPKVLLDIVQNFTLFIEDTKIIPRYQQYRAVQKAIHRISHGKTRLEDGEQDQRGGVIWHTQGSGKSLTMVFLIRKMRSMKELQRFKIVIITDRIDLEDQLSDTAELIAEPLQIADSVKDLEHKISTPGAGLIFGMIQKFKDTMIPSITDLEFHEGLNDSENILVLADEAHRSHSSTFHATLEKSIPNCTMIGFTGTPIVVKGKKKTTDIFGTILDTYTIKQSQEDGATLPILYEGRTTKAEVKDAESLDEIFLDMFTGRTERELAIIKEKYATKADVLEAPMLIKTKARDMFRHYVAEILPNGFKAQVVAVSRLAAVRYQKALEESQDELVEELEQFRFKLDEYSGESEEKLDSNTQFLVNASAYLDLIKQLKFATVISKGAKKKKKGQKEIQDPPSWSKWTSKFQHKANIASFKKSLEKSKLAFLVVRTMLLVGFDAHIEQVLYIDRVMKGHELLQAIARVNRRKENKTHGLIVDYIGLAHHLKEALDVYTKGDIEGALKSVLDELPILEARYQRLIDFFAEYDLAIQQEDECVGLLKDDRLRVQFQLKYKKFLQTLDLVIHKPQALKYIDDAKSLRYIHKTAANRYRDSDLNLIGVGNKVRKLIDKHIIAQGIDPKIGPIDILDADFEEHVSKIKTPKARAAEMEEGIRHHVTVHSDEDPVYYGTLSERLNDILERFEDDWEQQIREFRKLIRDIELGRPVDDTGLDPKTEGPFFSQLLKDAEINTDSEKDVAPYIVAIREIVAHIRVELSRIDFWKDLSNVNDLRKWVFTYLDARDLIPYENLGRTADNLIRMAKHRHGKLVGE